MTEKTDIKSLNISELEDFVIKNGEKKFRAKQIYSWIHEKLVMDISDMSNISKDFQEIIKEKAVFHTLKPVEILTSEIDGTQKYLFELYDGNVIESVLMKYKHGNSVCISSQVGCRMGCRFCASTIGGLVRNLSASEMLEQIYRIQHLSGERVSNIVVMGTGEPLDNFDNLVRFIELITNENGLHISQRNITISTCGLADKIRELADKRFQITLALSLHAVNDEKRKEIMPVANKYSIEQIIEACIYYFNITGRRVTFEYSLAAGVNDSKEDALGLVKIAKKVNSHINLIPINPIEEREFVQTDKKQIEKFKNILEKNNVNATIRREMGRDINGACGQLRRNYNNKK